MARARARAGEGEGVGGGVEDGSTWARRWVSWWGQGLWVIDKRGWMGYGWVHWVEWEIILGSGGGVYFGWVVWVGWVNSGQPGGVDEA